MARVEVVWRCGGRGEGVREGCVEARELRRVGFVKMGSSCWELGGKVSWGLEVWFGMGEKGIERTSCRGELQVASVRRDLVAEDSRVFLGFEMVCV